MQKHWSIAETKAKLSEVMRQAGAHGPQRIGARGEYLLVSAADWDNRALPSEHFGQWLVRNLSQGVDLDLPGREDPDHPLPFDEEEHP